MMNVRGCEAVESTLHSSVPMLSVCSTIVITVGPWSIQIPVGSSTNRSSRMVPTDPERCHFVCARRTIESFEEVVCSLNSFSFNFSVMYIRSNF